MDNFYFVIIRRICCYFDAMHLSNDSYDRKLFTKQSKSRVEGIRNAILYGLSIILIYVLLGSVITAVFGPEALNELSTSATFNIIFFGLLVVFALFFRRF